MTIRYSGTAIAVASCLALGLVPLAGASPLHAQQATRAATFDPAAFFTGRTTGQGTLREALSSAKPTSVTTMGTMRADGVLVLVQDVHIGDDPVRHRTWQLKESGQGRFTGSISDATTPVSGELSGNMLTLTYTLEGNLAVHQEVTLAADGQSAQNSLRIKKFGITVARMNETIHRR